MGRSGLIYLYSLAIMFYSFFLNLLLIGSQGLDFLATVCESQITAQLSDDEFEKFKLLLSQCVGHIIGSSTDTPISSLSANSLKSPQANGVRRFSKLTSK